MEKIKEESEEPASNKLAAYRRKRKLSQRDAALYTGCTDHKQLIRYEQGNYLPSIIKAARFAALYRTSVAKLYPKAFSYAKFETRRLLRLHSKGTFKNTIMAIYPGTNHFGVAVFPSPNKVKAFVRNVKVSPQQLVQHWRKVVVTLIKRFDPKVIIIERIVTTDRRRSRYLKRIIDSVKKIAQRYKIKLIEYFSLTVYRTLIPPLLRRTKSQIPRIIVSRYSSLKRYEIRTRRRIGESEPYFLRLFMAVALGMARAVVCLLSIFSVTDYQDFGNTLVCHHPFHKCIFVLTFFQLPLIQYDINTVVRQSLS